MTKFLSSARAAAGAFLAAEGRRLRVQLCLLAALGLAVRAAYVLWTRDAAPHPDMSSFFPSLMTLAHPFDTSPREPFFVWWLWLANKAGAVSVPAMRLATALWFVPSLLLLFSLASGLLGRRLAWAAALLYTFLPAQVQSDVVGLRHLLEGAGVLLLLKLLAEDPGLAGRRNFLCAAAALAALVLTRVNYAGSGLLLLAAAGLRARSFRPLAALLPALLLLGGHLQNNHARHGDAMYSVNLHTHFFSNLEFIGQPGFDATYDDWQKNVYTPRLNFRQWAFERHNRWELVRDSAIGLSRGFWDFYEKVYFSLGLPGAARWLLLGLYLSGLALAVFTPGLRLVPLWLLLLTLPYAFVGHVFWAGRFYMPFTPLALFLAVKGAARLLALAAAPRGGESV